MHDPSIQSCPLKPLAGWLDGDALISAPSLHTRPARRCCCKKKHVPLHIHTSLHSHLRSAQRPPHTVVFSFLYFSFPLRFRRHLLLSLYLFRLMEVMVLVGGSTIRAVSKIKQALHEWVRASHPANQPWQQLSSLTSASLHPLSLSLVLFGVC